MIRRLFLLCAVALGLSADSPPGEDAEDALRQFIGVFSTVQEQAADPIDSGPAIYDGAIPGMLRRLDPHSVFFDPMQFQQLQEMEHSERTGFGTIVSVLPGRVIVLQALPGTPSARAGLSPGDEIVAVNNIALARLAFEQIIQFLSEARQKQATLIVRRSGSARLLEFTLDPELVDAPSVDRAYLLQPGIGYVRVASFDPQTGKLLKDAIEKLGGANLHGLILDLRDNGGGVVEAALQSAALFLKPGQKLLSVKGRSIKDQEVSVPDNATPYSFPVSVLVNGKTASASEIVTGALQDHDRATVVGEPTYGKGIVQTVLTLSNQTAVALTTAFYYTSSGRSIQKPLETGQLNVEKQTAQFRTDAGRPVQGGGGIQPDIVIGPEPLSELGAVLNASGVLTAFATEYLQKHKVDSHFHATPALLDDFQVFASEHNIQPAVGEWIRDRDWIESRLEEEILNQGAGVEHGDQAAAQRDPQIKAAIEALH